MIVGGWAHRLHQAHPLAQAPGYEPVRTRDADVAFDTRARLKGRIADALHAAGFVEMLSSDETPPVAQYQLGMEDQGFYAEFLTPLTGSGIRRDGSADATIERAGIIAAPLKRAQDILYLHDTIQLFGGSLEQLNALWRTDVSPFLTRNQRASVRDLRQGLFATLTDTIRDAARIPVDRRLRPEEVREVCAMGLAALLSDD